MLASPSQSAGPPRLSRCIHEEGAAPPLEPTSRTGGIEGQKKEESRTKEAESLAQHGNGCIE